MPAKVPSSDTAPSVPAGTRRKLVIILGTPPSTCPSSDDTVSAVASAIAATIAASAARPPKATGVNTCAADSGIPASAATPRFAATCEAVRPRRASAVPSDSFRRRPNRVAPKVSTSNASSGHSAVCSPGVCSQSAAAITAPVSAAPGVAARVEKTTAASSKQIAAPIHSAASCAYQSCPASSVTHTAVTGTSSSSTACDCQRSAAWCERESGPFASLIVYSSAPQHWRHRAVQSSFLPATNESRVRHSRTGLRSRVLRLRCKASLLSRPVRGTGILSHRVPGSGFAGAALATLAGVLAIGCGNQYRPVITPINPTGPGASPSAYITVVSQPGFAPLASGTAGPCSGTQYATPAIYTLLDFAGDSVMAQANGGLGPITFSLDTSGSSVYTPNCDGSLTTAIATTSSLQTKNVLTSTLLPGAEPTNTLLANGQLT